MNISSTCHNICDKQLLSPHFVGKFSPGFFFVLQYALAPLFSRQVLLKMSSVSYF